MNRFSFVATRYYCRKMVNKTLTTKVQVHQGVVIGRQELLPNGMHYNCYLGVPYAVPPLHALRFKSPVPLERFDVPELDCTRERAVAHQRNPVTQQVVGSENCLFLNIYSPVTSQPCPLPVMVWIHGGGFMFGSSNSDSTLPLSLMEEGVIVVTVTYRLGALGFLCFPEGGVWGNAGLKDQRLALQWVQENIASFNGDPNNVTLFGESAGAAAVHLHAYSKHAHKLFHKAIMQSGTANMEWVFQTTPEHKTRSLAKLLGCKPNNSTSIMEFLQSPEVTPLSILEKTLAVLTADERRRGLPFAFKPVIEDTSSPDSFISEPIIERLSQRDVIAMPIIMGYNSAEGIVMVVNAVRKLKEYDEDLVRFVPRNISLPLNDPAVKELANEMRKFYFEGKSLNPKLLDALTDMLSDYHFTVEMQRAADLQVRYQPRAPLYFYRFNYVGERNMFQRAFQLEHLRGTCHADELFYLFQMANDNSTVATDDAQLIRRLSVLWTNFARYGDPTPTGVKNPNIDFSWTPVNHLQNSTDSITLNYLSIDKQCKMLENPDRERMEFWRNIYRTYEPFDYSRLSSKL